MKRLRIKIRRSSQAAVDIIEAAVYQKYEKFCVLDNGKFKFCAFYTDLKNGEPITM